MKQVKCGAAQGCMQQMENCSKGLDPIDKVGQREISQSKSCLTVFQFSYMVLHMLELLVTLWTSDTVLVLQGYAEIIRSPSSTPIFAYHP